jgi:glycosyltransferase involved in cell wall biosynthesis
VGASERLGVPRADAVLTVSNGIAARLSERYPTRRPPTVVRNLPDLPPPGAVAVADLRDELGIGAAPLVLHQGAVAPGRGCETLLRALWLLPDTHLLYLGAEGPYAEHLRTVAAECGLASRTHLLGPAPPEALLSYTAQADVGVSLLEDSCDNHRLALPNKLFEYVAAGLPVVVADLPEAAKLVRERRIGWSADPGRPESVAAALREALAQRDEEELEDHLRRAREELNWGLEKQRLLLAYDDLTADLSSAIGAAR